APYAYHPKGLNFLERDARDDLAWQREPAWAAFEPLVHHEFEHEQDTTRAGLVRLVASWAFIARLDEDTRADILRRADQLARDHGALQPAPMERALHTVEAYAHFCRASGLELAEVLAVATSAIREAENREDFLSRAFEASGLPVRVLSREEEARYGYLAAVNST